MLAARRDTAAGGAIRGISVGATPGSREHRPCGGERIVRLGVGTRRPAARRVDDPKVAAGLDSCGPASKSLLSGSAFFRHYHRLGLALLPASF